MLNTITRATTNIWSQALFQITIFVTCPELHLKQINKLNKIKLVN